MSPPRIASLAVLFVTLLHASTGCRGTYERVARGELVLVVERSGDWAPCNPPTWPKPGRLAIKVANIEVLRVRARTGSYWATGAVVGVVVDVVAIVVAREVLKGSIYTGN